MVKGNFKQIDLLRNRRDSNNLAAPYFVDTYKYVKKGIFSGLVLIFISLILGIPFILRIKFLENKKVKLKPFIVKTGVPIDTDSKLVVTPGYGNVSKDKSILL